MQLTLTEEQARVAWIGLMIYAAGEFRSAGDCAMTGRPHESHNANATIASDLARDIERQWRSVSKPKEARCDS